MNILLFLVSAMAVAIIHTMSDNLQAKNEEIERLKKVVIQSTAKLIKSEIKRKEALDDLFWCKHVNGQLIEKCDPSTVNRVIKNTPLPKMKGA